MHADEFKWGANAFFDSFFTFYKGFTYNHSKFLVNGMQVLFIRLFLAAIYVLFCFRNKSKTKEFINCFFFSAIIVLLIGISIAQRFIFDTRYPDARKSIMYISLLMYLLIVIVDYFFVRYTHKIMTFIYVLGIICILKFTLICKPKMTFEWAYDECTKDLITYLYNKEQGQASSIAMDWIFASSFSYYNKWRCHSSFNPIYEVRDKQLNVDAKYYYLIDDNHTLKIPSNCKLIKSFKHQAQLFERLP
jgi:hypothetical protein